MPRDRMSDPRLLGTWQSDRRETFRHDVPRPGAKPAAVRRFRALFGKLRVRWTAARCQSELDGNRKSVPYEVVATDADSVVVRCFDSLSKEYRLHQLHFEGDHYWLNSWGLREYFKRIE